MEAILDRISKDQLRLSKQLQLLDQFSYSDLDMPYEDVDEHSNKAMRNNDTNTAIRILDTIAVSLTTGNPGEVFAAAFDSRGPAPLALVLAKNDRFTDEDDRAVDNLLNVITSPETKDAYDALPFLFSRCERNIKKRVSRVEGAVAKFTSNLNAFFKDYRPLRSIEVEFPKSEVYRERFVGKHTTSKQMMRGLLANITRTAEAFNSRNVLEKDLYEDLTIFVSILNRSRLLCWLCADKSGISTARKLEVEQLKRRLGKVSQYYQGINSLIRYARRRFPLGTHHRWVEPIPATGEGRIDLGANYLKAMEDALGSIPPKETLDVLRGTFPEIGENWSSRRSINARLHAEIRIVLDISNPRDALDDRAPQQPIGCSKRSCLCCALWIRAYNDAFNTACLTSGSHGKPYAAWALPGCSYAHACVKDRRSIVDENVLKAIKKRLTGTLEQHFPKYRRVSDEYRSSGPESEDDSDVDKTLAVINDRFLSRAGY